MEHDLTRLDVIVEQRAGEFAEQAEEWRHVLLYLCDYADVAGRLPEAFDDLVAEVFTPLFETCGLRVVVLIPAHDEEEQIAETIDSVRAQTHSADGVVVIADDCSDRTAEVARSKGVDVFETAGNTARKAGALNQAYARVAAGFEYVLQMDADTALHPCFLAEALAAIWLGMHLSFHPIWLLPIGLITAERVVAAWPLGWRERLIAASFFPEELYCLLREAWVVRSVWLSLRRAAAGGW